ncbi:MAG: DUF222 domain-containing protein [Vicinamibacterales bacterium]
MATTALVASTHASSVAPSCPIAFVPPANHRDTVALGEQIAVLAMQLHAATYELLVLLREFDRRRGWNDGFASCAHWLHWRTGIDRGAAREKVRVAHALARLPRLSATMQRGAISYAKVRALTRVATPANEASLLGFAQAGTAAHVERLVRAWRRVDEAAANREADTRHLRRQLTTFTDDEGMVVIRGRLTPELGAVVQRALDAAFEQLRQNDGESMPRPDRLTDEVTPAQRRADALGLLAEAALGADLDRGTAGDRYQVVLHMEAPTAAVAPNRSNASAPASSAGLAGTLEVDHGAVDVSAETSRRVSCDAGLVEITHDAGGTVLDVGRKTRTVPPPIRRALLARDRTCRFPGCTSRRCDAHHIEHWTDGGATSLDNLLLLCRRHHRLVHEGGMDVHLRPDGTVLFARADGTTLEAVPPLPDSPVTLRLPLAPRNAPSPRPRDLPVWDGTRFDLVYAMDVLYRSPSGDIRAEADSSA